MKKVDLILQDSLISHQISLLRFTAGEKKKALAILLQLQKDLRSKLLTDLTDFSKARVNKLLKESSLAIQSAYQGIQQEFDFTGLAKLEAGATAKSFIAIGLDASLPTEAVMKSLVGNSLIEGTPSAAWWSKQSEDLQFKFAAQVRQGIVGNEPVNQIVQRIIGSPKLGTPGILETSKRGAAALVHTSVQQVANDARLATFRANRAILKGVRFLATLDGHTSVKCIAHSGAEWDLDGNPINTTLPFASPPLHFNCRSGLTGITKTYKELGVDIPEAPIGTRASDEGQVRADITMTDWLKSKPTEYVDELLGPGRAKLFLDGKITLSQLVDGQGRELTLAQLKAIKS